MTAVGGQLLGASGVGLFHEFGDRISARCVGEGGAERDVAIAGLGRGRAHAEGDNAAGAGGLGSCREVLVECGSVADGVVGCEQPQHGVGRCLGYQYGSGGDGWSAVAADGFEQNARGGDVRGPELFGDQEAMFLVAHDDGRREACRIVRPERGLLQQRVGGDQRPELLREGLTGHRPKAGAGTTGQDDRDNGVAAAHGGILPEAGRV